MTRLMHFLSAPALALILTACAAGPAESAPASANPGAATVASVQPADVSPGAVAPDFTLNDLDGHPFQLSSFRGKTVVLEWFNPGCPFVVYAHGEGPLKTLAKRTVERPDHVWLAINSGAPGKQGHGVDTNRDAAAKWGMTHPILVDESGDVGRLYGAKTTPEMFVIDPEGVIRYHGALDNAPRGEVKGSELKVHAELAIAAVADGQPVTNARTQPYGCSVKY